MWAAPTIPSQSRIEPTLPSSHPTSMAGPGKHAEYAVSHTYDQPREHFAHREHSAPAMTTVLSQHHHHDGRSSGQVPPHGIAQPFMVEQTNPGLGIVNMDAIPRSYHANEYPHAQPRVGSFSSVHEIHLPNTSNPPDLSTSNHGSPYGGETYSSIATDRSSQSLPQHRARSHDEVPMMTYQSQHIQPLDQQQPLMGTHPETLPMHPMHEHYQTGAQTVPPAVWSIHSQPIGIPNPAGMPNYNVGFYDYFLEIKPDDEDPSMQLPSARLATL